MIWAERLFAIAVDHLRFSDKGRPEEDDRLLVFRDKSVLFGLLSSV
jgi:hypothetical protein